MSNNTLPEEVRKEIEEKSIHYAENEWTPLNPDCPDWMTNARDYQAGATEYATWKVKHDALQAKCDRLEKALIAIISTVPGATEYYMQHNYRELYAMHNSITLLSREALQQHEKGGEDHG